MKKILVLLLALILATPLVYAQENDMELDVIRSLGIMNGNKNGDLMLSKAVTRAEFSTMATAASKYNDNVAGRSYVSIFSDVKSEHWASAYIKLAVDKKWFAGYVDGTFRPDNVIKYEEGIAVALRIMGYDFSEAVGVYPYVQLDKAKEIGLLKNINGSMGSPLTRAQCKALFYNILLCSNDKKLEGSGLNSHVREVPVNNGEIDYLSLIYKELEGPFVYRYNKNSNKNYGRIFKSGREISSMKDFDVYYQNKTLGRSYVFDEKIFARIEKILPNTISPAEVLINGESHSLLGYDAKFAFSALGRYKTGDRVSLLLGMDGKSIVGVADSSEINMNYYGILLSKAKKSNEVNGKKTYFMDLTVLCTDGEKRIFQTKNTSIEEGKFIKLRFTADGVDISSMPKRTIYGKITKKGIGDKKFAPDINMQEYYEHASLNKKIQNISLDDVLGANISSSDVVFYETDNAGDIETIVFNDITGNSKKYGVLYKVEGERDNSDWAENTFAYHCVFDGVDELVQSSGFAHRISLGGIEVYPSLNGSDLIRELENVKIYKVSDSIADTADGEMKMASNVQIYLKEGREYSLVNLENLDEEKHNIKGYYNKTNIGKRLRIIVATQK